MDDLIREFVEETTESLSEVESDLLQMEQDPDAEHDVGNLFRLVHTIKGTCSFIGLNRLGSLAHASENILGKVRDREMGLSADAVSTILEAVDVITQLLEGTAETGTEPEIDVSELIARLDGFAGDSGVTGDVTEEMAEDSGDPDGSDALQTDPDGFAATDAEPDSDAAPAGSGGGMTLADILGMGAGDGEAGPDADDDLTVVETGPEVADENDGYGDDDHDADTAGDDAGMAGGLTLSQILAGTSSPEDADGESEADQPSGIPEPAPAVRSISDVLANTDLARSARAADGPDAVAKPEVQRDRPLTLASILAQCGPGRAEQPAAPRAPEGPDRDDGRTGKPATDAPVPAGAAPSTISAPPAGKAPRSAAPSAKAAAADAPAKSGQSGATLRVSVDLLEDMMNLVGELVLTRNQLSQLARTQTNGQFDTSLQRLDQVTGELQEGIMKTRMQPIGNAWNKLPRIMRDLSKDLGKKIELEMIGADTELDRQVLELIKDPLTHMVRNSADHGIESAERRREAGKPEAGTVRLAASYKESHVVITLSDDGGGLDAEAIRKRVIERGLAKADEAEAMSDHQLHQFIFAPGFSTAKAVTSVSGRGVGMDVVRTNIEKIGGSVSLESELGTGTCFTIRIPLSLAILPVLLIGCGEQRYALPQINLQEVVQIRDRDRTGMEQVSGSLLYRYRDDLIPIVDLAEICGETAPADPEARFDRKFIVVCRFSTFVFGVMCDRIFDTEEIIAKPLARILSDIRYFSGNAILGDGTAIFILDPNALAARVSTSPSGGPEETAPEEELQQHIDRTFQMIIFEGVGGSRKALPITLVDRVEEIRPEQLERIDDKIVVQYEGKLMPILEMDEAALEDKHEHSVIVFHDNQNYLGMRISRICDIAELEIETDIEGLRPGCLGATVSEGRVIEILDVSHMMSTSFPQKYGARGAPYRGGSGAPVDVLLVDDSRFFRNFIGPLLRNSGYNTTVVERPKEALDMLEQHSDFDVIISDIEMPEMDGYELLRSIRARSDCAHIPVIALSSYGSKTDVERGLRAGFNAYVSKLDKNGLLKALQQAIIETEMVA